MILLPIWLPALVIGLALQWLVIRGAVLSALRRHASNQHRPRDPE
jgi:ABC-type sulfate transport system permease component